ncbi:MAG: S8 family peptidase [Chitinophagaceae bacterium]|nr:S8 family peptidase [Chitinophagaceae bacterium]
MNTGLVQALLNDPYETRSISLLVKGNTETITATTKQLGGSFKYKVSAIVAIRLPLNKVDELASTKGITHIEGLQGKGQLLDDMTLLNANVSPVHSGFPPLTQAYDGNGVVMAVLDDGIDFLHPDFQHEDGTTRIKYLWDQTSTYGGTFPEPYEYGQEWDSAAIDGGFCTHVEPAYEFGHGSNVAGIATGNGKAINNFIGVAPACDIISVAVSMDENFLNNMVDATKYAFDKASAMSKPCVINASLGTYFGSHDGYDLAAQLIDELIAQQNGRAFVCAAGNAGNIPFHLGYETAADSSFTWFKYNGNVNGVFYEWWINKSEATAFNFAIGADNNSPFEWLDQSKYFNLLNDFDFSTGSFTIKDTLWNGTTRLGIATITAFEFDSTYACDVFIQPDFTGYYWRFITNGNGRFDLWSGNTTTGTSDMVTALPSAADFPDIIRYKLPNTEQTIVSSFTCSKKVITIANYINRNQYIDYYGDLLVYPLDTTGDLAATSSFGPTRDGRVKPDAGAPGNRTLTTGQLTQLTSFILSQNYKVALGGMHNVNSGTSMASPVVAGIAALYLQKNPSASYQELKDAILLSCFKDSFTGNNLPDNKWGYGKVDAFATMNINISYGCTNPFSLNYNPSATVDDGSCIPVVFGCTDNNAVNYNTSANMDNGSCLYNVGMAETNFTTAFIRAYPNPSYGSTNFYCQSASNEKGSILIYDLSGSLLHQLSFTGSKEIVNFSQHLGTGLYFYRLETGTISTAPQKLVIY